MRLFLLTVIFVAASVAATLAVAHACRSSCKAPVPVTAASRAAVAFVGTITKTHRTDNCEPKHPDWCTHSYSYDVAVEGVWKGKVGKTITVIAGSNTGDCSVGSLGKNIDKQRWLFFSHGNPVRIRICSGTQRATDAAVAAITAKLGAPTSP